ncbi:MAG: right-handed parallel beta-helix repeat-containing protein [Verrucomicrobiia bacterium]
MLPLSALNGAQFFNDWAATNLVSVPSQNGPLDDPDNDGTANLAEFTFGTDPLAGSGFGNSILPVPTGTDGVFQVSLFEQGGHKPGVQIDVDATVDLVHWIRPWWLRTTNSLPGDPTNSVRETFITYLPGANLFIVRAAVHLIEAGPEAANYYVATNGNDGASGTSINTPYRSLAKAASLATTGNLIYVRGGTYSMSNKIVFTHSGSPAQPIRLRAYPGELPILDCTLTADGTDCLVVSGNCWQVYGLMITNSGHNSIRILRDSNIVERCVSYGARNTGIHISGGNGAAIYPSSNLVLNCDVTRSYDLPKYGQDADGFSAKWSLGNDNVFRGCRSWENSDDGWDLWMGSAPVLIENCWAFRNGIDFWGAGSNFAGNGNGFKLGGSGTPTVHHLVGSLSFGNRVWGVDQNDNADGQIVDQNTVWNNGGGAINLNHLLSQYGVLQSSHVLRNNAAIGTVTIGSTSAYPSIQISNTWQVLPDVNTNDFLSTDWTWAMAPRRDDGGLPETPFMRPVPGGRLVDLGTTNVGIAFYGSAPDLGAFESPTWDGLH